MTTLDLLMIFPETKDIIPEKIKEWEEVKRIELSKIKLSLLEINSINDEFSRWFWREAYKLFLPKRYLEAITQLMRLRRLQFLTESKPGAKHFAANEQRIELAKQISILSLYPFERLRRTGTRHIALCPFHKEKTPSFTIYPNNSFYCFGCHKGGDAIYFVMSLRECSFLEAIKHILGG